MTFSIITPTNNTRHLGELYASLVAQTQPWEWVLVPNGGLSLTGYLADDRRVRSTKPVETSSIGRLKKIGCEAAFGDILVEVDHDDMLAPNCLEELAAAFADQKVGFAYSDTAHVGDYKPFGASFGWVHYRAGNLLAVECPPVMPASFANLTKLPDHVRAWRAVTYRECGGHNPLLPIADDHELLCRTYLWSEWRHIPKPLYLYRHHANNAHDKRRGEIQRNCSWIWGLYQPQIYNRWAELNGCVAEERLSGDGKYWVLTRKQANGPYEDKS
jgi:O-antigen biosynthesis protein